MNGTGRLTSILYSLALTLIAATGANAASTNKVYMSGTLIMLFLGFCALVVVIQLIPALMTLYGMIKGALSGNKEKAAANVRNH